MRWKQVVMRWLPVLAWMGVIFFFSSRAKGQLPSASLDALDWGLKKTAHMLEYGVLAVLLWRAISPIGRALAGAPAAWSGWVTLAMGGLYAVSDEFHQGFVPGREPAVRDVLIDLAGMLLGILVLSLVLRHRRRQPAWFRARPLLDRFLAGFRPLRFAPLLAPQDDPSE